ncbi:MarR family winged helix-turn-helix transcriptional regulator [Streptomyces sp. NPDC003691]
MNDATPGRPDDHPDGRPAPGPPDPAGRLVADWRRERADLDADGAAVIARLCLLAENVIGPAGEAAVRRHGVGRGEFDVLATLRRGGEPYTLSPSALAAALTTSRAGTTKRLDKLERAGLVVRGADPEDRRGFRITLTAEGCRVADAALTDLTEVLGGFARALTEQERASLDHALRTLADAADARRDGRG